MSRCGRRVAYLLVDGPVDEDVDDGHEGRGREHRGEVEEDEVAQVDHLHEEAARLGRPALVPPHRRQQPDDARCGASV